MLVAALPVMLQAAHSYRRKQILYTISRLFPANFAASPRSKFGGFAFVYFDFSSEMKRVQYKTSDPYSAN